MAGLYGCRSSTVNTAPYLSLQRFERRRVHAELRLGLGSLSGQVAGLRGAREALALLLADADLAWRIYATSLLAEALAEE